MGKSRLTLEVLSRLAGRATVLRGPVPPVRRGHHVLALAEMVRQAAGIDDGDSAGGRDREDRGLADRGIDDAALVAGPGGRGDRARRCDGSRSRRRSGPSDGCWRPSPPIGRSWPCSTTSTGRSRRCWTSSSTWPASAGIIRCSCSAWPGPSSARPGPDWDRPGTVVTLSPLDPAASDDLIRNLIGSARLPSEIRDRIVEAAEGNPLFVEEMLRIADRRRRAPARRRLVGRHRRPVRGSRPRGRSRR